MSLEKDIEKDVAAFAAKNNISVHKWKGANERGLPDRIFIVPGLVAHWFCIEFKKPGGKLRPAQVRKISHLRTIGVSVYVEDSVDGGINAVKKELEKVSKLRG